MKKYAIDGTAIETRCDLHRQLALGLGLPEWYGGNLDALRDCLTDPEMEAELQIVHPEVLEARLGNYARSFFRVLKVAAEENKGFSWCKVIEVVAALVQDEGFFMICQRPAHKVRGLLWEFVGGKTEPGETGPEALIRECKEELGVTVSVGDVFMEVTHEYPDLTVHLTVYNCELVQGSVQLLEHNDIRWITPEDIPDYAFCPADAKILEKLRELKTE